MTEHWFCPMARNTLIFVLVVSAAALGLTEREALLTALGRNADITVSRLSAKSDSLWLESVESGWLPSVTTDMSQDYTPYDTSYMSLGGVTSRPSVSTSMTVTAEEAVPGGGRLYASVSGTRDKPIQASSPDISSSAGLGFTQPLLRDAWRYGGLDHSVRIRRLDNARFTIEQRKTVLATCSQVRRAYWALCGKLALQHVFCEEQAHAKELLAADRRRFEIGKVAPIDTLSSRLDFIKAAERYLGARADAEVARRDLAVMLDLETEATVVDTLPAVRIHDLPQVDELLRRAETFDPQLRIFETLAEKLMILEGHARNALLPYLDVSAEYSRTSTGDNLFEGSRQFGENTVVSLILRYSVPTKPRRIAVTRAGLDTQKNDISHEEYKRELRRRVDELAFLWERETESIKYGRTAREIAHRQLVAAQAGFEIGTVERLALGKAKNDYVDASVQLVQKEIAMKRLEIIFDEMTGAVFTRFGLEFE